MDYIDILALLRTNDRTLKDVKVYGVTTRVLSRPSTLRDDVVVDANCKCVEVDVVAVDLSKHRQILSQYGMFNGTGVYLVNGKLACYLPTGVELPDWYVLSGNLSLGTRENTTFVTMFNFYKNGSNWGIRATQTGDINIDKVAPVGSRVYSCLHESAVEGRVVLPADVLNMPAFTATHYKQNGLSFDINFDDMMGEDIQGLAQMQVYKPQEAVNVLRDRDTVAPFSENYDYLDGIAYRQVKKRNAYIDGLREKYELDNDVIPDVAADLFRNLESHYKKRVNGEGSTGRAIIKRYIDTCDLADSAYGDTSVSRVLVDMYPSIVKYLLEHKRVDVKGDARKALTKLFGNIQVAFAGVLAVILGLQVEDLVNLAMDCTRGKISFIDLILSNPYDALIVSHSVSFSTIEHVAHALGLADKAELAASRNIGMLGHYILKDESRSTCFKKTDLLRSPIGLLISGRKYESVLATGTYLSSTVQADIRTFISKNIDPSVWNYATDNWVSVGYEFCQVLAETELRNAIGDYVASGMGAEFEANEEVWISEAVMLQKELFVYNYLHTASETPSGYKLERINELIELYEKTKGFTLEEQQRKSVQQAVWRGYVICGEAGSGKTTTVDCLIFVLENYTKGAEVEIQLAAPSWKAARRLHDVTGKTAKTLNTAFRVGTSDENLNAPCQNADVYIFDEMSMVTLPLLYSVLRRCKTPMIVFVGDTAQLDPIGKGLPFKDAIRYMVCTELNVSKRSAEGSGITLNSNAVSKFSTPDNWRDLKSTADFKLFECADRNIAPLASLICKYHLGTLKPSEVPLLESLTKTSINDMIRIENLKPSEIQIISPVNKETYSWGTSRMNKMLQPLFTLPNAKTFECKINKVAESKTLKVGDRVINTRNMSNLQWYVAKSGLNFEAIDGFGVVNGDVGEVVDMVPAWRCTFDLANMHLPDDGEENVNIRNDSCFNAFGLYFLIVKYYDVNSMSDYFVLYRCNTDKSSSSLESPVYVGSDLGALHLFYAGSTHKMQGSQARLVISLFGYVGRQGFLTRNMLYTTVTRASEGQYLIGNVSNHYNSVLSQARRTESNEGVRTIGQLL